MNILFLISCINSKSNGLGGHYHSLKVTVKSLAPKFNITIACVGTMFPKALENFEIESGIQIVNLTNKKFTPFYTYKKVANLAKKNKCGLIHSFDRNAFFYGRLISFTNGSANVLTKCGGDNKGYLPFSENIICYSKENFDFLKQQSKFSKSQVFLIPNRINKFESDFSQIKEIRKIIKQPSEYAIILRISRLGKYYLSTNINTIKLVKKLNDGGVKCVGVFVGTIESDSSLQELKRIANDHIYFFNEDSFTKNAKSLIDCANLIVGTGRSLMEGMSKSKIVLSPLKDKDDLVLLDSTNFEELFYYNFSERSKLLEFDEEENFNKIKKSIQNNRFRIDLLKFIDQKYCEYFDASVLFERHHAIYSNIKKDKKIKILDFIKHTILQIKLYRK